MDFLAHFLWSYLLFHNSEYAWLAAVFGIIPDIIFLIPMLATLGMKGHIKLERPPLDIVPGFIMTIYNSMHSLVTFFLAFFAVYFITGQFQWYMLAWLIHILVDIPLHSRSYFPTMFLYPLTKFSVNGYPWEKPWLVILNYILLMVGYAMLFIGVI